MALLPIFRGLVRPDATLVLRETERARRQEWLRVLAQRSGEVELIVRPPLEQRSLDQNSYLHGVPFRMLHEWSGHTVEEVKRLCLAAKFGSLGVDANGWPVPVIAHTSSLDKQDGSALIEFLPPYIFELTRGAVDVPLPGDVEWRL